MKNIVLILISSLGLNAYAATCDWDNLSCPAGYHCKISWSGGPFPCVKGAKNSSICSSVDFTIKGSANFFNVDSAYCVYPENEGFESAEIDSQNKADKLCISGATRVSDFTYAKDCHHRMDFTAINLFEAQAVFRCSDSK